MIECSVPTYTATIYVGQLNRDTQEYAGDFADAEAICQAYCDEVGLCVTIRHTLFVYMYGREEGVEIGLINYPRFPSTPKKIREHAMELARRCKEAFHQYAVTVVFPDKTVMLKSEPTLAEVFAEEERKA